MFVQKSLLDAGVEASGPEMLQQHHHSDEMLLCCTSPRDVTFKIKPKPFPHDHELNTSIDFTSHLWQRQKVTVFTKSTCS